MSNSERGNKKKHSNKSRKAMKSASLEYEQLEEKKLLAVDLFGDALSAQPNNQFILRDVNNNQTTSFKWGDTIRVSYTVRNNGSSNSTAFNNRFVISTNTVVSP